MNDTVRDILAILEHGKPELQVAAAQILGELKPKVPAVCKTLEGVLERGHDRVLGRYVLEALAKLGSSEAVRAVARNLQAPEGIGEQAAHLLAELGKRCHAALAEQFDTASFEARARMLQIVGREPSKEGLQILEKALFQHELSEQAARILAASADRITAPLQKQFRESMSRELGERNGALSEVCLANALDALGTVDPSGSRAFLIKAAGDKSPSEVRMAALRALQGVPLTAAQARSFLTVLQDTRQKQFHEAVRDLLIAIEEWPSSLGAALKKLVAGRQVEQRLFALRALRNFGTPEVAKIALKFLGHAEERFRDAGVEALAHNKSAIEPMLRALQIERNPEKAALLIGILVRLKDHFQPRHLRALVERASKLIGAGNQTGEGLLEAALTIDGAKAAPMLLEKAVRMRRVRRFKDASRILMHVASSAAGDVEAIYQLALARLLLDASQPRAAAGNGGNATMGYFAQLVRDGVQLFDRIKKETMLGPEVQLRLARHFVGGVGAERKFGLEILQHLAARSRGKIGEEAKQALRTSGF